MLRTPSIDTDEVAKFSAMAAEWWDPKGKLRSLHRFNPVRLGFIRDTAVAHFGLDERARKPLEGLRLLDIGCGGGLVSEPMARLGASVTGVDAGEENIKTAMTHARESGLTIDYRAGTAEGLLDEAIEPFDIVLNMEVMEHVADPDQFLKDTATLVRPGGLMIAATLNRTPKAFALAIVGAEYVLGWLPRGTHEYSKFLTPEEVSHPLKAAGLVPEAPQGVSYNPIADKWRLSSDDKVNYMIVARRPKDQPAS
ncbi:bifunctional 2-polyprenyl-6-hydroxyphenol methylase/3-demethylubiquinol 3-O-methyltransferase UbiG [Henriciella aquimarina]|uniref:bifunctional 2-polyprenyl-6-hydroxyphenol methylase/3-demethylubiquinol 3-O-methyltransferase UbiG n=1 Tax=Henriciella aquimarina TaxID=545261 RepID=UPI0009FF8F92|nr:bifunctional 2-polyprenyl-6-hydroxyphenol methylase/3-demethylubiquinol 3-O-methyltransferase UbiG [Henriciella aquimarina]